MRDEERKEGEIKRDEERTKEEEEREGLMDGVIKKEKEG